MGFGLLFHDFSGYYPSLYAVVLQCSLSFDKLNLILTDLPCDLVVLKPKLASNIVTYYIRKRSAAHLLDKRPHSCR
jgi:hypothetical protein